MPSALIVAEYGSLNGGEKSLLAIVPDLQQAAWQLQAVVPAPSPFADSLAKTNVEITPFEFTANGRRKPLEKLRTELAKRFIESKPDLVHCNSLSASRICGPVCKKLKIGSVGYVRDIIKLGKQAIEDLNCLDRIVAVSNATESWHVAQGVAAERLTVIHNGVNPDEFLPGEHDGRIHRQLDIPEQCPIVLFVGQIGLRKGVDTWLDTAQLVLKSFDNVHFLIVGQRHSEKQESILHEQELRQRSVCSPLSGHVHWLGTRNDVNCLMSQSTILLHCARQEPLGRVLLEASSCGLPIVATDVGGTAEILCHKDLESFLIPVNDPQSAANAVVRLLQDRPLRNRVSKIVRQIAIDSFPVSACSQNLIRVYEEVRNQENSNKAAH